MKQKLILITALFAGTVFGTKLIINKFFVNKSETAKTELMDEEMKELMKKHKLRLGPVFAIFFKLANYKDKNEIEFIKSKVLPKVIEFSELFRYESPNYYLKLHFTHIIYRMIISRDINDLNFVIDRIIPKVI